MVYLVFLVVMSLVKQLWTINFETLQQQSFLEGWQEFGFCLDPSKGQSPIQIVPPFSHIELDVEFRFNQVEGTFFKNTGHELVILGQFGFIQYNRKQYNVYELKFKSPSEHSLGTLNLFFPLEMQIFMVSQDLYRIGITILFQLDEEGRNNQFLNKLGFGRNILKDLTSGESFEVPEPLHLGELVDEYTNFLVYQGSDTYPPCTQMIWLISFDLQSISPSQATDYPTSLVYMVREIQKLKRPVFSNFDPALFTMLNGKQVQTQGSLRNIPIKSSDQRISFSDDQVFKDSFTIIGDTTILDIFVYTVGVSAGKVIRNRDYTVVKVKEYPKKTEAKNQSNKTSPDGDKFILHNDDHKIVKIKEKSKVDQDEKKGQKDETQEEGEEEEEEEEEEQEMEEEAPLSKEQQIEDRIMKQQERNKFAPSEQQTENPGYNDRNQNLGQTDTWPSLCRFGKQQSPIVLKSSDLVTNSKQMPVVNYTRLPQEIFLSNDGLKIKLIGDQLGFGQLRWDNKQWFASEVHFHHPSEHALGDNEFHMDLEVQIIHRSKESEVLIVVVFLHHTHDTDKSSFLEKLGISNQKNIKYRQIQQGELITLANRGIRLSQLIDGPLDKYISYTGSLTSPPCIEGIQYLVKRNREPISQTQINNFISLMGRESNVRPLQNLNHRIVYQN